MASKKRKKQRSRQRQAGGATPVRPAPEPAGGSQPAAATAAPPAPASARQGAPSYASGVTGPRRQVAATAAGTIDIDARVPYLTSDLRRVLLTAAVMIVLIIVGSLLIH